MSTNRKSLRLSLFLLRISVFIVMLMWTLDKFINPAHAAKVYENFYFISGLSATAFYIIGAIEILILLGFLLGIKKKYTYGAVLAFHSISTLSSFKQYMAPFDGTNLLFFAAWPMLAACLCLFIMRDEDKKFTLR